MSDLFKVSPLSLPVKRKGSDEEEPLYRIEIEDLSRAFCGALFLALPLHFTMEMWERARFIPPLMLFLVVVLCYFINVGFAYYSGFKSKTARQQPWLDAFTSMGIGALASTITLLLIDQLSSQMSFEVIISCIVLEMVPTSFGASLAKSQLGSGGGENEEDLTKDWSRDKTKMLASLLGAVMFAFNVASTQEPIVISTSIKSFQLIGIIIFSLFISYLMTFMTGFSENREESSGIMGPKWAETIICYSISLIVSAALLVLFGYLTPDTPPAMALPWIVVLGYATSLGGSAGRLII